jgi:WD40 repeat protein
MGIGGAEGRVFLYDPSSKSKIGMNEFIHCHEIIAIFFIDRESQMLTVSRDKLVALWDTNMFECLITLKDVGPESITAAGFDAKSRLIYTGQRKLKLFKVAKEDQAKKETVECTNS